MTGAPDEVVAPGAVGEAAPDGVGDTDGFDRLWSPHRMAYILGEGKPAGDGCPFCDIPSRSDEDGLVVARGSLAYAVLNLFPYNPGHLMLVPYRHVAGYDELTAHEANEIAALTQHALRVLRTVSNPGGFNLGVNLGAVGGAGIAAHLHQHVVPRWTGDTNYMPVVGQTRVLPQLLRDTRQLLADAWDA